MRVALVPTPFAFQAQFQLPKYSLKPKKWDYPSKGSNEVQEERSSNSGNITAKTYWLYIVQPFKQNNSLRSSTLKVFTDYSILIFHVSPRSLIFFVIIVFICYNCLYLYTSPQDCKLPRACESYVSPWLITHCFRVYSLWLHAAASLNIFPQVWYKF